MEEMKKMDQIALVYTDIMKIMEDAKVTTKDAIHIAKEIEVSAIQGMIHQAINEATEPIPKEDKKE